MNTILVTGANGQLGQSIQSIKENYPNFNFVFAQRADLDISDQQQVTAYINRVRPQWIINCAAYTAVDKAESESDRCYAINEAGSKYLAQACHEAGAALIHVSSDYVYHSNFGKPFTELDITNPQGVYAKSKLAGEEAVKQHCNVHYVIRTSWVFSEYGHNFVKSMIRLGHDRSSLNVVCDQIGAPTYARDLAQALLHLVRTEHAPYGTYNYANAGQTSWYNFARAIHQSMDIECLIHPIRTEEYPTDAERPPYSLMNLTKIKNALNMEIRDWEEALSDCIEQLSMVEI